VPRADQRKGGVSPLATTPAAGMPDNERAVWLIEAYRERGDRRAVERVFEMYGRLLNHIVRRYSSSSGEPYEDLLQVGYVGLVKAVNGYKTDSSAKFSSYAYSMIDGELRHHFRDTALVRRPRWARSLYARVAEATSRLTDELGRPPLVEEIAREVNVAPEGIVELMKLFLDTSVTSLDEEREGENGPDLSAIKSLQYETFSLPIEDRIQLEQALESLTELQRKVVYLFFYKDLSQTEIGRMLGLPQRKVSRIIAASTKALRDRISNRGD
jgi:RNA polymerase sigma-B factor